MSPKNDIHAGDFFGTAHLKADLKSHSIKSGSVTLASNFILFLIGLVSYAILGRLLTPDAHGLIDMIMPIVAFILLFRDFGFSHATIQSATLNHGQVNTLFWVNVIGSAVIMVAVAVCAPLVAWFYGEPRLQAVTVVLALGFFLGGLTVQHQAILRRQMRFRAIAVIEITAALIGLATATAAALGDLSYWSLVIKMVVTSVVVQIGMWLTCAWRPTRLKLRSGARSLLSFGAHVTGSNVLNYASVYFANILIGKFRGTVQLSFYGKARVLLLQPIQQINRPISTVAVSTLSKLTDEPDAYRSAYMRLLEKIAMLTMPGVVLLVVCADWVILTVLGSQWEGAIGIFTVLGLAAFILPIVNAAGWLYISQGRSRHIVRWSMMDSIMTVGSYLLGMPWGVRGVAAGYALVTVVLRTPMQFWYATREGPVKMRDFYRTIAIPALVSLIVLVELLLFRKWAQPGLVTGLISVGSIGTVSVLGLYRLFPATRTGLDDFGEILKVLAAGAGNSAVRKEHHPGGE